VNVLLKTFQFIEQIPESNSDVAHFHPDDVFCIKEQAKNGISIEN